MLSNSFSPPRDSTKSVIFLFVTTKSLLTLCLHGLKKSHTCVREKEKKQPHDMKVIVNMDIVMYKVFDVLICRLMKEWKI